MPKQNPSATSGGGAPMRASMNSASAARIVGPSARNSAMDKAMQDRANLISKNPTPTEFRSSREQQAVAARADSDVVAKNSVRVKPSQSSAAGTGVRRATGTKSSNHQPRIGGHAN